jgi:hypothetical protein
MPKSPCLVNKNKALAYGGEMVLPFYILHQTIILLVGWYVIAGQCHALSFWHEAKEEAASSACPAPGGTAA